jgi:uncharacterized membrane protein (UPF0182 family)
VTGTAAGPPGKTSPEAKKLINQAVTQFERAKELQRNGDWSGYGEQLKALERTLQELKRVQGNG